MAIVPATVPEQPDYFLPRESDLARVSALLLSSDPKPKVAALGMGGTGKTTIAAAVVKSSMVRESFDKIVWVSLGQDPNLRQLQESIHVQLTREHVPETATTATPRFTSAP